MNWSRPVLVLPSTSLIMIISRYLHAVLGLARLQHRLHVRRQSRQMETGSKVSVPVGRSASRTPCRSAISTVLASTGGGICSVIVSLSIDNKIHVDMLIDGLLSSLVASSGESYSCLNKHRISDEFDFCVAACCACLRPWQAFVVGVMAPIFALATYLPLEWAEVKKLNGKSLYKIF